MSSDTPLFGGRRRRRKAGGLAEENSHVDGNGKHAELEAVQVELDVAELQARAGRLNWLMTEKVRLRQRAKELAENLAVTKARLKETEWLIAQELGAIARKPVAPRPPEGGLT